MVPALRGSPDYLCAVRAPACVHQSGGTLKRGAISYRHAAAEAWEALPASSILQLHSASLMLNPCTSARLKQQHSRCTEFLAHSMRWILSRQTNSCTTWRLSESLTSSLLSTALAMNFPSGEYAVGPRVSHASLKSAYYRNIAKSLCNFKSMLFKGMYACRGIGPFDKPVLVLWLSVHASVTLFRSAEGLLALLLSLRCALCGRLSSFPPKNSFLC